MQVRRLVPGIVRPAAPEQIQAVAPYRDSAPLKVVVLLQDSINSARSSARPWMGSPLSRLRSSYTY